jgi:hypothetical protein
MNKLCYTERGKTKRAKPQVTLLDVAEEEGGVELRPINATAKKCGPLSSLILYDCRVLLYPVGTRHMRHKPKGFSCRRRNCLLYIYILDICSETSKKTNYGENDIF